MKTMKKLIALIMSAVIILSLAACGGKTEQSTAAPSSPASTAADASTQGETKATAPDVKGNFVMGTGGVSGVWYPLGGVICGAMSKGDLNVTVQSSGGTVENIRTIFTGERDFGLSGGSQAYFAYNGLDVFEGEQYEKLRVVAALYINPVQFITTKDSGNDTIHDFKGKVIGVGAAGSGDNVTFTAVLNSVGYTYDDIDEKYLSVAEQCSEFKDRRLDIMTIAAAAPTSSIMDVAASMNIKLISFTDDELKTYLDQNPWHNKFIIPKDTYNFLTEDVTTIGNLNMIVCSADLDDDVVYAALTNMFENLAAVQAAHPCMASFTMAFAADGFPIPGHPGAEKFFADHGLR